MKKYNDIEFKRMLFFAKHKAVSVHHKKAVIWIGKNAMIFRQDLNGNWS